MKKHSIYSILLLLIIMSSLFSACSMDDGKYANAKFKVWGNCEMCKERIEEAVKEQSGVKEAEWDVDSKIIEIKYDSAAVNINTLHKIIAAVGHDTELIAGDSTAYDSLHSCCQYKRK